MYVNMVSRRFVVLMHVNMVSTIRFVVLMYVNMVSRQFVILMYVNMVSRQFNSIQLFFFSQTMFNTQINNNKQIIENKHN